MLARWCFLFLILGVGSAHAFKLHYVAEASLTAGFQYKKAIIGGLSGIVWQGNNLYALSDDKGRMGEPRFFSFGLTIDKNKVELKPNAVHFLSHFPLEDGKKESLDPEGFAPLGGTNFIFSSEGSGNAKPREMPRLAILSATGIWKSDLPIPAKFLPEKVGQQKKGVQNNLAFESLTSFSEGKVLFAAIEAPLSQDESSSLESSGRWIRILKYDDKGKEDFRVSAEYAYRIDDLKNTDQGFEVFRGVSEILAVSESKLIVMERGVRLSQKNVLSQTVTLYLADLSKASNVMSFDKLSEAKFLGAEKTKIIDFETDLNKERPGKKVQNFEALSWGPILPDGRKTLLVMSDNNFSKKDDTELIVFAVEGE
ncbi:MAG: esterase-like activity of phytase family protein [Bdellovibrio sp.]|nr:esterase-like activity of phytase family protein [Bdellovibrio sp.]